MAMNKETVPPLPSPSATPPSPKNTTSTNNPFNFTPAHFLFISSLPICLGAYAGFRVEMTQAATTTADAYAPGSTGMASSSSLLGSINRLVNGPAEVSYPTSSSNSGGGGGGGVPNNTKNIRAVATNSNVAGTVDAIGGPIVNAGRLGFKALGIGSLLSVGGVGLLTAGVFYLSGCDSLQELIHSWRRWTPARRREMEQTFGIKPKSLEHEDVKATADMTEEEEWDFIKKKYIPELVVVEVGEGEDVRRGDESVEGIS